MQAFADCVKLRKVVYFIENPWRFGRCVSLDISRGDREAAYMGHAGE